VSVSLMGVRVPHGCPSWVSVSLMGVRVPHGCTVSLRVLHEARDTQVSHWQHGSTKPQGPCAAEQVNEMLGGATVWLCCGLFCVGGTCWRSG